MFPIVDDQNRIRGATLNIMLDGQLRTIHHYLRFIGRGTELWIFGSGLGEYTLAQQIGDSFLTLVDRGEDPQLGRIMWSLGFNPAATHPYKGDINIVWSYGVTEDELAEKINSINGVRPDVVLSPHKPIRDKADELGMRGLHMHAGVGRFFKNLHLKRDKVGFAGLDNKSATQKNIVLGPALDRGILDWRTRKQTDEYMTIDGLVDFYNTLKVTFGMIDESRQHINYMPSRLFEVLATGTPLIMYKPHNFEKNIGFKYPYLTTSYEETEAHMDYILNNQERVLEEMVWYQNYVKEFHSYERKLSQLFEELKK